MFGTDILMCRLMPFPIPCQITARGIACRGYKRPNKRSVRHDKGMMSAWRMDNTATERFGCRNTMLFALLWQRYEERHMHFYRETQWFCDTLVKQFLSHTCSGQKYLCADSYHAQLLVRQQLEYSVTKEMRLNKRSLRHHKGMTTVWRRINKATELSGCGNTVSFAIVWRR